MPSARICAKIRFPAAGRAADYNSDRAINGLDFIAFRGRFGVVLA